MNEQDRLLLSVRLAVFVLHERVRVKLLPLPDGTTTVAFDVWGSSQTQPEPHWKMMHPYGQESSTLVNIIAAMNAHDGWALSLVEQETQEDDPTLPFMTGRWRAVWMDVEAAFDAWASSMTLAIQLAACEAQGAPQSMEEMLAYGALEGDPTEVLPEDEWRKTTNNRQRVTRAMNRQPRKHGRA